MNDANAVDLALLILRVGIGATIAAHGYNHLWGPGGVEGTADWFDSIGMRHPRLQAWAASVTELAAGVMLILGLLTPLGAAALVGVMVVAWVTAHRENGFFIFKPGQGWEYVAVLSLIGVTIGALGPGRWSLDHALDIADDTVGWPGLLIALGGAVAAVAQLAVFWRPSERSDG